jgi:APA family basic amino acid/polyamine antiporter
LAGRYKPTANARHLTGAPAHRRWLEIAGGGVIMRFMRTKSVEWALRVNLVLMSIPVLRRTRPDLQRPFKVPLSPWLPCLSAAICALLMPNLSGATWIRFLVWLAVGLALYGLHGYRRSRLATEP